MRDGALDGARQPAGDRHVRAEPGHMGRMTID